MSMITNYTGCPKKSVRLQEGRSVHKRTLFLGHLVYDDDCLLEEDVMVRWQLTSCMEGGHQMLASDIFVFDFSKGKKIFFLFKKFSNNGLVSKKSLSGGGVRTQRNKNPFFNPLPRGHLN